MADHLPQAVLDAADISAITQLILTERESRDLARWQRMRDCFHDDARIQLSWITGDADAFVAGSIDMAQRGMKATHRVSPIIVRLAGERAIASLGGIIDIPATIAGVEVMLSSHARFLYRVERREGQWRISFFDAVYVRDEFTVAIPGQSIPVTPHDVARFRPSYRMLSYLLSLTNYEPNMDLAGTDRPETVARLETEIKDWGGIDP